MTKVIALDDDFVILSLVEAALDKHEFDVRTFNAGADALAYLQESSCDIVISDLMMPTMDGEEFFLKTKVISPDTPFLFLTSVDDLDTAVKVMKLGADDYLRKPIKGVELVSRVRKTIQDKKDELLARKTIDEDIIDQEEHKGLFSWKQLYGMKDTEQTNRIMSFLSRNVDQAGGFMWLDVLREQLAEQDPTAEQVTLKRAMVDLILESTEYISRVIADLNYVTKLLDQSFLVELISLDELIGQLRGFYAEELLPIVAAHDRRASINVPETGVPGELEIDRESLFRICRELLCNAIKYSPDGTKILVFVDIKGHQGGRYLEISIWNSPKETELRDDDGAPISGIPYKYSESVFELFYTMDTYSTRTPEEEWGQGTGLYIVRRLLQTMNAHISARNIVMHTIQRNIPFVKVTMALPFIEEG